MSFPDVTRSQSPFSFSQQELLDLAIAWVVLSVAFALLLSPIHRLEIPLSEFVTMIALSFVTVGVAFLLHELAHKVVAIRFGQVAEFRADYQMLFLAVMSALIGFLFAAPGAVYHRGRITLRENGIIALAGPLTNHGLALLFVPFLFFPGILSYIGHLGVLINLLLAAFNMIPFGPLDGKSVWNWHKGVFVVVFLPSVLLLAVAFLVLGFP
ncbi:zinc metalloprotease [Natronobiforma cellulositropha]|uniref:metalloprotease n=1 Tax=Natronobiforma cellulositropha TaxID=1679076 RepID=UPI0021D5878D|nr:metalloprotease [Natronobiforma cellulositropha]